MEIKGYKVFIGNQSDFKNNAGLQCKVGQILETTKPIVPKQNGYHFAKRLEDTLPLVMLFTKTLLFAK